MYLIKKSYLYFLYNRLKLIWGSACCRSRIKWPLLVFAFWTSVICQLKIIRWNILYNTLTRWILQQLKTKKYCKKHFFFYENVVLQKCFELYFNFFFYRLRKWVLHRYGLATNHHTLYLPDLHLKLNGLNFEKTSNDNIIIL